MNSTLRSWTQRYAVGTLETLRVLGWRTWTPFGQLLTRGKLKCDMVEVLLRAGGRYSATLMTEGPPTTLLKRYLDCEALLIAGVGSSQHTQFQPPQALSTLDLKV